jgi:hypothetical protein
MTSLKRRSALSFIVFSRFFGRRAVVRARCPATRGHKCQVVRWLRTPVSVKIIITHLQYVCRYKLYACVYIYVGTHTLVYVHYIGARPPWCMFFPHTHGTSRAPHFGDQWSSLAFRYRCRNLRVVAHVTRQCQDNRGHLGHLYWWYKCVFKVRCNLIVKLVLPPVYFKPKIEVQLTCLASLVHLTAHRERCIEIIFWTWTDTGLTDKCHCPPRHV